MRAKDLLLRIQKYECIVENKISERDQQQALAMRTVSSPPPDTGVRVQASGNQQKMSAAIERYIVLEDEINAYIDKLVNAKREVIEILEQLDAVEYNVLHKMYVGVVDPADPKRTKYYTLREVANIYDRSYDWAKSKRGQALKSMQRILDARDNPE